VRKRKIKNENERGKYGNWKLYIGKLFPSALKKLGNFFLKTQHCFSSARELGRNPQVDGPKVMITFKISQKQHPFYSNKL
jgi:hypothetical protein